MPDSRTAQAFSAKVVLITGASRGLGLLLARRFAEAGARLALLSRSRADVEATRNDPALGDTEVLALGCDVTSRTEVQRAVRNVIRAYGHIDVVINNAGIIKVGPFASMDEKDFEEAMGTHFWGPLYMIWATLPYLRQRGGRMVNISSIGGVIAVPHLAPYISSKFALSGLSEALTSELADEGIRVTTVYPVTIRTGSPYNVAAKGRVEKEFDWFTLGDSLPLVSKNAERAARQIVRACAAGKPRLIISTQARLAIMTDAVLPNVFSRIMSSIARVLPDRPRRERPEHSGWEARSGLSRSPLVGLTRRAASHNRELDTHVRRSVEASEHDRGEEHRP